MTIAWKHTINIKPLINAYNDPKDTFFSETRHLCLKLQETLKEHEDLLSDSGLLEELEELVYDGNEPDEDEVNFFLDQLYEYGDNVRIFWGL